MKIAVATDLSAVCCLLRTSTVKDNGAVCGPLLLSLTAWNTIIVT